MVLGGIIAPAIWNVTARPWRTTLPPIFTKRSCNVIVGQCDGLRQRQATQEIARVVGHRLQLEPHRIGRKALAAQPRPGDSVLILSDALLGRAAAMKFARTPLDLGEPPSPLAPGRGLPHGMGAVTPEAV